MQLLRLLHRPQPKTHQQPLLDHIDIGVDYEKFTSKRQGENSATIRRRMQAVRERQLQRFTGFKLTCNAEMSPSEVRNFCNVESSAKKLLKVTMEQLHLSARAFHRLLRLARTLADLVDSELIVANHVAEAIQYRPGWGYRSILDR